MKNKNLYPVTIFLVCGIFAYGQGQTDYYKAAANAYRNAAAQTKCQEKKQVLLEWARYEDCRASKLGNSKIICNEPNRSWQMPCSADEGGVTEGTGSNKSTTSGNNSSSNSMEAFNAGNAAGSAYLNALNSGKKESGAMLDATLSAISQLSDPSSKKAVAGAGSLLTLINFLGEKKEEKIKAQKEAKAAAIQLFSENIAVLNSWEQADFSHKTGTLSLKRNKKGYVKGLEFLEGVEKFYDYVVIENSPDSIRIVMVEQYANGNNQGNIINVIHEFRFSISDINSCAYYEDREEFGNRDDETEINFITPIDMKAVANIIAEGDIGTSSTSLPTGLYILRLNVDAYKYRMLACLPSLLKDSFLSFFTIPFTNNVNSYLEYYFGSKQEGKAVYNILNVFTY